MKNQKKTYEVKVKEIEKSALSWKLRKIMKLNKVFFKLQWETEDD